MRNCMFSFLLFHCSIIQSHINVYRLQQKWTKTVQIEFSVLGPISLLPTIFSFSFQLKIPPASVQSDLECLETFPRRLNDSLLSPAMFRRSLWTPLALSRASAGFSSGGDRFRSIVFPKSGYPTRVSGPLRRRLPRGIHGSSAHVASDGIESGVVHDIPRYHASHLLFVDKFLRGLGDISLRKKKDNYPLGFLPSNQPDLGSTAATIVVSLITANIVLAVNRHRTRNIITWQIVCHYANWHLELSITLHPVNFIFLMSHRRNLNSERS